MEDTVETRNAETLSENTEIITPKAETNNSLTLREELNRNNADVYCSIKADTTENKKKIYNALNNCDYRVADVLNMPIKLANIIAQKYDKVDETTGEVQEKVRTILIDADGKTYASASKGLFNSCKKLFAFMGMPDTWDEPITIQIQETKTKQGFKTFEIIIL